ncbi:hypothetical protein ACIGT4_18905 [Streptomyces sioyaensis]
MSDRDGVRNIFSGSADQVVQARSISGGVHFHGSEPDRLGAAAQPRRS